MRKVRAPVAGLAAGERTLDPASAHYLTRVLRLREGDAFVAFDPALGTEAEAEIVSALGEGGAVVVRAGALRARIESRAEVTWVHGIAKGEKTDAIVRDATELGATRFVVATTERSVVKLSADRSVARRARWERIAQEAARQSGRADAPRVDGPLAWAEAIASVDREAARFVLWEEARAPLGPPLALALGAGTALAFAAGPEGGLTKEEARFAEEKGWSLVSLGPLVLRTETVAAAVLGAARIFGG
jgi:16S rRNA (uracil1498-N3)-methyltransferase